MWPAPVVFEGPSARVLLVARRKRPVSWCVLDDEVEANAILLPFVPNSRGRRVGHAGTAQGAHGGGHRLRALGSFRDRPSGRGPEVCVPRLGPRHNPHAGRERSGPGPTARSRPSPRTAPGAVTSLVRYLRVEGKGLGREGGTSVSGTSSRVYRRLRWSEASQYPEVVLLAVGKLERSTGLDENAEATVRSLSRRSVWLLLGLLRLLGRPLVDVLVAVDGKRIVGTGTILWLPQTAYVAGMATRPEYRGQGIASRILSLQTAEARRRHRAWLALDVESENETAIRVYRKSGLREMGQFTWFSRLGLPPAGEAARTVLRPVAGSDWPALAARLDSARPFEYRSAFPAGPRGISHNEVLIRGGRLEIETWAQPTREGGVCALRVYHLPISRIGALFPVVAGPEPAADELAVVFEQALAWMRRREPLRLLAASSSPAGGVGSVLERMGFAAVVSSTVMLRGTSA